MGFHRNCRLFVGPAIEIPDPGRQDTDAASHTLSGKSGCIINAVTDSYPGRALTPDCRTSGRTGEGNT